jgi:hypothetical protein
MEKMKPFFSFFEAPSRQSGVHPLPESPTTTATRRSLSTTMITSVTRRQRLYEEAMAPSIYDNQQQQRPEELPPVRY